MVALEVMAIILLVIEPTVLRTGWNWLVLLKLAGIAVTIYLIGRFAAHLTNLFQTIRDRTTHWRVHWLVLLVLVVCAVGERLGLDAAKTAFVLGLAMLTIVALAAKARMAQGVDAKLTAWLVLTGLFMTIPSLLLLPPGGSRSSVAPTTPARS